MNTRRWAWLCILLIQAKTPMIALDIVKNSLPRAEIVLAADAHSAEKFAAEDLRHWVAQITGGELPIVPEATSAMPCHIYIGKKFAAGLWQKELRELDGTDGYAVCRRGDDLYLFGHYPRSAIYASSNLIEKNSDLIWARPDENYGAVFSKTPTLSIKKHDFIDKPVFRYHGWNVVAIRRDFPTCKWVVRMGGNYADQAEPKDKSGMMNFLKLSGGHIYWWMAHPNKYFKEHPEYYGYSKLSGKREANTLCLTAPGLIDLAVENLAKRIDEIGEVENFHIGFRDSWNMCQCPDCLAPIKLADGTTLSCKSLDAQQDCKYYSTRYWLFVSEIAGRLRQRYPKMGFTGSGYMYAAEPPACDIPEFMHVDFCPIGGVDARHPILSDKQAPVWRRRLLEWGERFPGRVYYYEYYCSYDAGYAKIVGLGSIKDKIIQDLRDMKEKLNNGPGVIAELTPDSERKFSNHTMKSEWDAGGAFRWICAKVMWNPYQDFEELEAYYCQRTYREAAPAMRKFYAALHKHFKDPSRPMKGGIPVYLTEHGKDALAALHEAEKLAVHPNSKIIITRLKEQFLLCQKLSGANLVPRMAREEGYMDFDATCYETALLLSEFATQGYFDWGQKTTAEFPTELRLLTDGEKLYARFLATNRQAVYRKSQDGAKPSGDCLYFKVTCGARVNGVTPVKSFHFDGDGTFFSNESKAEFKSMKTQDGYKAILAIPLSALNIDTDDPKSFPEMMIIRKGYDGEKTELSTLNGDFLGKFVGKISF